MRRNATVAWMACKVELGSGVSKVMFSASGTVEGLSDSEVFSGSIPVAFALCIGGRLARCYCRSTSNAGTLLLFKHTYIPTRVAYSPTRPNVEKHHPYHSGLSNL